MLPRDIETGESFELMLDEVDHNLKRLRIEYEQYFMGSMKREPLVLHAKVQKLITRMVNEPPRNPRLKFRFNSLNARFQVYRQLWGRTLREIEAGTYRRDRFKAAMRSEKSLEVPPPLERKGSGGGGIDKLYDALVRARRKAGSCGDAPSRATVERMVRKQIEVIRQKRGAGAKVRFRIVLEGSTAKIKASAQ